MCHHHNQKCRWQHTTVRLVSLSTFSSSPYHVNQVFLMAYGDFYLHSFYLYHLFMVLYTLGYIYFIGAWYWTLSMNEHSHLLSWPKIHGYSHKNYQNIFIHIHPDKKHHMTLNSVNWKMIGVGFFPFTKTLILSEFQHTLKEYKIYLVLNLYFYSWIKLYEYPHS